MQIEIVECQNEYLLTTPFAKKNNTDISEALEIINKAWKPEQYHMGVGCYISFEKIKKTMFDNYDGMFIPITEKNIKSKVMLKPKGTYLCGYIIGPCNTIPKLYEKMLNYANTHNLNLTGYAYERWLNDFVISEEEYITQIMIKIE